MAELLETVQNVVKDSALDVAIVTPDPSLYAAVQHQRRRATKLSPPNQAQLKISKARPLGLECRLLRADRW